MPHVATRLATSQCRDPYVPSQPRSGTITAAQATTRVRVACMRVAHATATRVTAIR